VVVPLVNVEWGQVLSNLPGHVFDDRIEADLQAGLLDKKINELSEAGLPVDYLKALSWQNARACFHADQAFVAARTDIQSTDDVKAGGIVWKEPDVIAIAETIACVHAMHAMAETILEMINDLFSSKGDEEEKAWLSFNIILKILKSDKRCQQLYEKLSQLESSTEFQYIRAFCNTVKHEYSAIHQGRAVQINVPPIEIRVTDQGIPELITVEEGDTEQGMKFVPFGYEVKSEKVTYYFLSLWAREIYLDYRGEICKHVVDVLKEISTLVPAP
jgi:hypothetical protein